jgi:hypothetical protein
MHEPAWLQAAVAVRLLFPPPGVTPPPRPGRAFFEAVAILLSRSLLALPHILHALSNSFSDLAKVWTGATFDAAMKTAASLEGPMRAPTATGLQIDLSTRDCELERALGDPLPLLLLMACIRRAPWTICATLISFFAEQKILSLPAHRGVGFALLDRVATAIKPMHAVIAPRGSLLPGLLGGPEVEMPKAQALPDEAVLILEVRWWLVHNRGNSY